MDQIIAAVIFALLAFAAWIGTPKLKKTVEEEFMRDPFILPPDEAKAPSLTTVNGCGVKLYGDYRHFFIGDKDTFVSYYFFVLFFIPLIPLKCYRVFNEGERYWFVSRDEMKGKELLCIYLDVLKWVFSLIALLALIV